MVDVDGIVASFSGAAAKVMSTLTGKDITHDDVIYWEVTKILESEELRKAAKEEFNREGFCHSFEIYDGSQAAIRELSEISDLYFVTAPLSSNRTWMPERVEWLQRHFNTPYSRIAFVHDKFIVHGDFLIEDHPDNAAAWSVENPLGKALLWDRAYNQPPQGTGVQRVVHWNDVISEVKAWTPG